MTVIADKTFAINALRTRTGTNTTTVYVTRAGPATAAPVNRTFSAMTVLTMLPTSMQTDHASANQHGAVMTAASGESSVTQSVLNASPDKSH
jgi:hypothetical protein